MERGKMVEVQEIKKATSEPMVIVNVKCRSLANDSRGKLNVIAYSLASPFYSSLD
jgi:hypothetical protein